MTNAITWTAGPPPEHMRDGRDVLVWVKSNWHHGYWHDGIWYADGMPVGQKKITHHAEINAPDDIA